MSEVKGNFKIINDTVYFDKVSLYGGEASFYEFAVIENEKDGNNFRQYLKMYKNKSDDNGMSAFIATNNLKK